MDLFSDQSSLQQEEELSVSDEISLTDVREKGPKPAEDEEVAAVQNLTKKENRRLQFWRFLVVAIILATGAFVSACTYKFLKQQEHSDYVAGYSQIVATIQGSTQFHARTVEQAYSTLSEMMTAAAIAENQTFPYVTLSTFEVMAYHSRLQSGTEVIVITPIVYNNTREWVEYSAANVGWVNQSRTVALGRRENTTLKSIDYLNDGILPVIWSLGPNNTFLPSPEGQPPYLPGWQMSPPPFSSQQSLNYDINTLVTPERFTYLTEKKAPLFTAVESYFRRLSGTSVSEEDHESFHSKYVISANGSDDHPHSSYVFPVQERLNDPGSKVVSLICGVTAWDVYVANLLPDGVEGITAVLKNSCGQEFTYMLNGSKAVYLGQGDFHETAYSDMEKIIAFRDPESPYFDEKLTTAEGCNYLLYIYPTSEFEHTYDSNLTALFTGLTAGIFFLMALAFFTYDMHVRKRNDKVVGAAARSNAIVSSLFPSTVRDRLFDQAERERQGSLVNSSGNANKGDWHSSNVDEQWVSRGGICDSDFFEGKPIADLFPETSVLFADIVGFTAWSSAREPFQVFMLLETLYRAFDVIAKRRRVFKVETIGDCYVAATGLPEPRKDHALLMARFARDCLLKMNELTKKMEVTLGPDTSELNLRVGIHSGPVTAGVLRGERSRFQLFGDTMNTAARMESTGDPGRVQISEETANCLIALGRESWIQKREEKVFAKGKGELQTYWLLPHHRSNEESTASSSFVPSSHGESDSLYMETELQAGKSGEMNATSSPHASSEITPSRIQGAKLHSGKTHRLIHWNVEVLARKLRKIIARRMCLKSSSNQETSHAVAAVTAVVPSHDMRVMDEVTEVIILPKFDATILLASQQEEMERKIVLDSKVEEQLLQYVTNIAAMYRENPFHSFEHASHVTMSVEKLMSRVVAPTTVVPLDEVSDVKERQKLAMSLHDHTYGIISDPLTQFACVFSAIIHDVDHQGVPNSTLIKEHASIAAYYKGKSIAEQNSVDLAWNLLMDDSFQELYETICATPEEQRRFRQLVVNAVMATDIVDQELKTLRNARWDKAFAASAPGLEQSNDNSNNDMMMLVEEQHDTEENANRKATIVIEHMIQASDVAHTMQHWHIYRRWNEAFFRECHLAFLNGRAEKNPAEYWYEGELGFFDYYIIPLAKKLKSCGVFGVSSEEYLNYAIKNRAEWAKRGKEIVNEMLSGTELLYEAESTWRLAEL